MSDPAQPTPPPETDAEADPTGPEALFGRLMAGWSRNAEARLDPERVMAAQLRLWQDGQRLWAYTTDRLLGHGGAAPPVIAPEKGDHRFADAEWAENPVFDYIKQAYLLNAEWAERMIASLDGVDPETRQKIAFYGRQFVEALAPTNFLLTNPAALRETVDSGGENLRKGLDNFAAALGKGRGPLAVEQVDGTPFVLGKTIAATPGAVVFQNALFQLVQYAPTTETVHKRPLLIVPPWINKFYILDLRPENSFIRWCVAQGYTVFVISWVNPDASQRALGFDDYLEHGVLAALDAVEEAVGEREVAAIGYCIGGTLLAMALAWLAQRSEPRIAAATFFAAQVDFEEAGELRVFTGPESLRLIETEVARKGYLDGAAMATAFNLLRARDLIWHFAVNNYLMGKTPRAFDLLYWNADSTRFPERLLFDYLRGLYQENRLAAGRFELFGRRIDLGDVRIPLYIQASEQDHIAPAASVFKMTALFGGSKRFMLAGSGHIAGVINPPDGGKYCYWVNPRRRRFPDIAAWRETAEKHPGSWWPDWHRWISRRAGARVPARTPGAGRLAVVEPAPGSYVAVRSDG